MFYEDKCIDCRACIESCAHGDVLRERWPVPLDLCSGCGECVDVCYAEARHLVGYWMTIEEVLGEVLKDRVFYEISSGGVTVGGGEPTLQPAFVSGLLSQCRDRGLHTAIETCGLAPWDTLDRILEYVDLLFLDIKHMDSVKHREMTGVGNERILENARRAVGNVEEMIVRIPLIPGFNNDSKNIGDLARFVTKELPLVRRVDIMPYNTIGESKSERLGRTYPMRGTPLLSDEEIHLAESILQSNGLEVRVGG
jgi:pyruvate formate lyase activating enzyme